MATINKVSKRPVRLQKKKLYTVTIQTDSLAVARALAVLAKCAAEAEPEVTTFDSPLPGCGGPGDPC